MDIEVTKKTASVARQYKLSAEQLAFADLLATGWEPEDAWAVAIRKGIAWTKKARKEAIEALANNDSVKERIESVQAVLRKNQIEAAKNIGKSDRQNIIDSAMSKEQMLFDLQEALLSLPRGSKEWIDIKKMIVDVTRMKQDEIKDDNNTIHHYLPVNYPTSCEYCLLNPKNKKGAQK